MNKMKKFWLPDLLIVLAGILLDQFTKYLAVIYLKGQEAVSLIPGVLELRYLENRGAAFGMMQGGKIFFLIITPIILALVIYAMYKMPSVGKYRILHILLACVAGWRRGQHDRPYQAGLRGGFHLYQPDRFPDL